MHPHPCRAVSGLRPRFGDHAAGGGGTAEELVLSPRRAMLPRMTEAATTRELCDCPRADHPSSDGRCTNPSIRSEDPEDAGIARFSECGCCMADCPDVHPTPEAGPVQ